VTRSWLPATRARIGPIVGTSTSGQIPKALGVLSGCCGLLFDGGCLLDLNRPGIAFFVVLPGVSDRSGTASVLNDVGYEPVWQSVLG
jgi:hypothetical protein